MMTIRPSSINSIPDFCTRKLRVLPMGRAAIILNLRDVVGALVDF